MVASRLAHKYQDQFSPPNKGEERSQHPVELEQGRAGGGELKTGHRGEGQLRPRARALGRAAKLGHVFFWSLANISRSLLGTMWVSEGLSLKLFAN